MRNSPLKTRALLITLLMALPATASAGPWVPDPGQGYFKTWVKWLPGMGLHDADGENLDYAGYHELGWNMYLEFGVAPSVALYAQLPLVQLMLLKDPRADTWDAHLASGDPTFGLRWRALSRGRLTLALESSVRLPANRGDPVAPVLAPEAPYAEVGQLTMGSGVVDVLWGVSAGLSFSWGYAAAAVAYVLRTGDFDHDLLWSAEGGLPFLRSFNARLRLAGRHPLDLGDAPGHLSPSGAGNGTSYVGFAAEVDYRFPCGWVVGLTLEGGLAAVFRQSSGPVISLSLARSF